MMTLTRVKGVAKDKFSRIIKILRLGTKDVREADEVSPFGIDSHPINDMIAIYAETIEGAEPVIIGYMNPKAIANIGELRLYSTDAQGSEKNYMWLKNDGNIEIGGSSDNMVRFSKLEQGFNELRSDFNTFVTTYNSHTHPGGEWLAPIPLGNPSLATISQAKIDNIKTK